MNLVNEPWIPTTAGLLSLKDVFTPECNLSTANPIEHAPLTRFLISLSAHADGSIDDYLEQYQNRFDLFHPDLPFMQMPLEMSEELKLSPITTVQMLESNGRDQTPLFGLSMRPTMDHDPRAITPAEAARNLITFHGSAPSKGRSAWNVTLDTPLARNTCFLAEGNNLTETIELNKPMEAPTHQPFWEQILPFEKWRDGSLMPLDEYSAMCFPWFTVTLDPNLKYTRFASGPKPDPQGIKPDPHTHIFLGKPEKEYDAKKNPWLPAKNPSNHSVMQQLIEVLYQTFTQKDPDSLPVGWVNTLPIGFVRAYHSGTAKRIRANVNSTRTGQPVAYDTLEASLPWPTIPDAQVLELLSTALLQAELLRSAGNRLYYPTHGGKAASTMANELRFVQNYWQNIWPALSLALMDQKTPDEIQELCEHTAQNILDHHTKKMFKATEAQRKGINMAKSTFNPKVEAHAE